MSCRYDEGTLPLAEVNPLAYAPNYPHDPIEEIGTDVFMARGSIKMNPIVRITRNMGIIREDGDVTLINPIQVEQFAGQNPVTADRLPKENVNRPNLVKGDDPRRRIAERRV